VEKGSKLELFGTLARGMNRVCYSLQKLLDIAPTVLVSRVRKPQDYGGYIDLQIHSLADSIRNEGPSPINTELEHDHPETVDSLVRLSHRTYLPGYGIVQRENSAPYVADRIAKLLLELLWRFAAACEVRSGAGTLPPTAERTTELITSIMLQFAQVDSVLIKALQLAFSRKKSMSLLQYNLTQLQQLNKILKRELYGHVAHRQFFGKATEWLDNQVERERAVPDTEVFRRAHPEVFGDDVVGDD